MANPWDNDPIVGGPIGGSGNPVIAPPDPYKTAAEERARRDQELQEEANARARAAEARANRSEARAERSEERAAERDNQGSADEKRIATLLTRIAGAASDIQATTATDAQAQMPGFVESVRGDLMPGGIGGIVTRTIAGPSRRSVHDAQRDALDALLTLGTGAAYNAEQLSGQMASYFPQYGDTEAEIDVKNTRLQRLIEAAKANAGVAWDQVGPAIEPLLAKPAAPVTTEQSGNDFPAGSYVKDGGVFDQDGNYLGLAVNMPEGPIDPPSGGGGQSGYLDALAQGAGSVVEGVGNLAGIVVDPLATTLGRALGYENYTSDFGSRLRSDLGLPENQDRMADTIIRGGTAALGGGVAARGAAGLARSAPVQNALAQFGATPIRDAAAGAGAGAGGEIGQQLGGTPGQIAGTLAGGIGGYAGANALASRTLGTRAPNELMQSADRFGVTMLPADVGGAGTRMASGAVGSTLGGIPLAEGAERAIASAGPARDRIASSIGNVSDNVGAGQAARRGFREFTRSSKERADQLYSNISVAPDAKVQLANTRGALTEVTRGLESNPELSKLWANHPRLRSTLEALTPTDVAPQGREAFIAASQRYREAIENQRRILSGVTSPGEQVAARQAVDRAEQEMLAAQEMASSLPQGGELSWQDMNRFRSIVGEIVGQPGISRDGSDIAALRKLYGALSSDMEVTAAQAGPKALREFNRATQYWRGREGRIDDVFNTLFGSRDQKSDDAVFRQINSWAQDRSGDFSRLARTIRSMPDDEANVIRSTVIQRMGQAKPAKNDTTGEVFSPSEFSTQWNSLSPRAKSVLFPSKQHRQDLDSFAKLMEGMKRATEYQNFSRTALGANALTQGALALANLPAAITLGLTQLGAGKLLASPRFARLIASTSRMPTEAGARRLSEQLEVLATREPALAADAQGLQQYLREAFNQSPVRAAAGEDEADRRREPVR